MKCSLLVMAFFFSSLTGFSQLKTTALCPPLDADIMSGKVNKLHPRSSLGEIKVALPCTSEIIEETDGKTCKGIFFKDEGLLFFTDRNYIEITDKYKGKMTPKLMGADRGSLFSMLGYPKIKDISWEAYQMEYGILILYYDKANKINKIQMSTKTTDNIKLCE